MAVDRPYTQYPEQAVITVSLEHIGPVEFADLLKQEFMKDKFIREFQGKVKISEVYPLAGGGDFDLVVIVAGVTADWIGNFSAVVLVGNKSVRRTNTSRVIHLPN